VAGIWIWYMRQIAFIGTDDAFIDADRATINSKILGRIALLAVDEGDSVQKGDTLVKIDDSDLKAQLAKAEASVEFVTRSAAIASVNLDKAKDDFARTESQFQKQIVTREQYDHSKNALDLATAQRNMALSQIATAKADLAIVETQIGNTVIVSPFSGVVAKRWALQGDVIQPGQAILSMFDNKHIRVTANYEETKLKHIHPGMKVQIFVDAAPEIELHGKVVSIGQSTAAQFSLIPPSNASGNYTKITQRVSVKISLENPPDNLGLIPGLSVTARISTR
jgi:membrane fusion protein, multidrug efflux system